ncbi:hypothetical protein CRG98_038438 [Punica granatum]|nr:hypothetical protein CRG98_038438 [Punica granatum]
MAGGGRSRTAAQFADLLQSCIDKKWLSVGKLLHARLLRLGLHSDTFLFNRLIELCSKCVETLYARRLFDQMPHRDVYSWNAMLGAYCKSGKLQEAHDLFGRMPERNAVSWNNVISALAKNGLEDKALGVFSGMVSQGLVPTRFTLASVFSACGALSNVAYGRRCHGLVVKIGLDKNVYVGNALLGMYAKCGCCEDAVRAFGDVPDPNEVSITTIMGVLAQTERVQEALHMFRLMLREGINVDSVSLSSVLGLCTERVNEEPDAVDGESKELSHCMLQGQQIHGLSIKLGFEKDRHLTNSLLDMYTKNGDMGSAERIFSNLLPEEVSVVTWNVMIAGYGYKSRSDKAMLLLQRMQSLGFKPDEVTYINMLVGCVRLGNIGTAREMFDNLSSPTLSSWNAMISCYFQSGNEIEALRLFRRMQFRGVQPDRTTLAVILGSCAGMGLFEFGRQVHAASLKGTYAIDVYVASGLISMYSKCGKAELAQVLFNRMTETDIVCWNSMMAGLAINSRDMEAFALFKEMRRKAMVPTQFSYTTILSCCGKLPSSSVQGRQVHAQIVKEGYANDVFVGSALIDMHCKCGDVDGARKFFDAMPLRNTVTWNEMIHGYAQNGRGHEAVALYRDMIASSHERPDSITFVAVLTACSHGGMVDEGITIFNSMQREHGVEPALDHYTCIIDSLGRAGRFNEAEAFIDRVPSKDDPIIWEVLLSSCRIHGNVILAKRVAEELHRLDPQNSSPYVLLANIYASQGRWDEARAVRELMDSKKVAKNPGYSWIDIKSGDQTFLEDDFQALEG